MALAGKQTHRKANLLLHQGFTRLDSTHTVVFASEKQVQVLVGYRGVIDFDNKGTSHGTWMRNPECGSGEAERVRRQRQRDIVRGKTR